MDKCPWCGGELLVREYGCRRCGVRIIGEFRQNKFANLDEELLKFIEVFLVNEGNISAVGEELGWSYPKVKSMLRRVIEALGYEYKGEVESSRLELLSKFERGEISFEKLLELLEKL